MQNGYIHKNEINTAQNVTGVTGIGTYSSALKIVNNAVLQVSGYVAVVTGVSGNTITFQLYEQNATTGILIAPTGAVTIAIGGLIVSEWGY